MENIKKYLNLVGYLMILGAVFVFALIYYYWHRNNRIIETAKAQNVAILNQTIVSSPSEVSGKPIFLELPSLALKLNIKDGEYNVETAQWTLSNDSVHHALNTPNVNNERGNTLIYGHYRPGIFSTLKSIQPGKEAWVKTDNNLLFKYKFIQSKVVKPNDTSVFSNSEKPVLTLQTCTGAFMQNRQLFSFEYIGYEKI